MAINIETEKEFPTAGGIGSTYGLVQYETVSLSNVTKVRLEMLEYCFLVIARQMLSLGLHSSSAQSLSFIMTRWQKSSV